MACCSLGGGKGGRQVRRSCGRRHTAERSYAILGKLLGLEQVNDRGRAPSKDFWRVPTRLNATPMAREKREAFYNDIADGVVAAVKARQGGALLEAQSEVPETNLREGDVYRAGTVLEMAREIAFRLKEDTSQCAHANVRICVQGAMQSDESSFASVPLALNGMRSMMENMDLAEMDIKFGGVGAEEVASDDGVHIIISPMNSSNQNVIGILQEHVARCQQQGCCVVLLNPLLEDVPSPNGVMQVQGRADRIDFVQSFECIYWFSLIFKRPALFPIYGCLRMSVGGTDGKWVVYRREGKPGSEDECFNPIAEYDSRPSQDRITAAIFKGEI